MSEGHGTGAGRIIIYRGDDPQEYILQLERELTAERERADRNQEDAERYRYLRHIDRRKCLTLSGPSAGCWIDAEENDGTLVLLTEEDADAAIDAARRK